MNHSSLPRGVEKTVVERRSRRRAELHLRHIGDWKRKTRRLARGDGGNSVNYWRIDDLAGLGWLILHPLYLTEYIVFASIRAHATVCGHSAFFVTGFYSYRIAGGDRHHRDPCVAALARAGQSER